MHIGPNDPEGMLRHTQECRDRGYPFLADPSQQLAFGDGEMIRDLIDGAEILFSNEYESALITQKTGWTAEEVLSRVGTWVVTLGAEGVRIERQGEEPIVVQAVPEIAKVEPTGVGDAFRAGFLAALSGGWRSSAPPSSAACSRSYVVERVGTQEYTLHQQAFVDRFAEAYGDEAAAEIAAHVRTPAPDRAVLRACPDRSGAAFDRARRTRARGARQGRWSRVRLTVV